jgi:hypothetical protein
VICLDEPSCAPGRSVRLAERAGSPLFIGETGAKVPVASGVVFLATDNTNGTGGGTARLYRYE